MTAANSAAERLQRRLRWPKLARSASPDIRVALLSTFTVEPLVPYLGTELADTGVHAELWVAPFNQIELQCLAAESPTARFGPQIVVCVARLEELWSGRNLPLDAAPGAYEDNLRYLAEACRDAAGRWNADLVFVLPPVPETRPLGVGDDGNECGVAAVAAQARESVRRLLAGCDRVHIVDAEAVLRSIGSRAAYRPALLATARIPYSEEYFHLLARRISRLVTLVRLAGRPLLVLDADVFAGSDPDKLAAAPALNVDQARMGPETTLAAYLAEMARGSVSIAVCNATPAARARLEASLPVVAWAAAATDRPQQVRELAVAAGVGLDRVVFLGSQQSAAEILDTLPAVTALQLPPDHEDQVSVLNDSAVVDQLPPARPPVAARPGATPADAVLTLEGFLDSLRLSVHYVPLTDGGAESAADLTRRVSEFHLNGEVWSAERFAAQRPGTVCLGVTVSDRFGDYGLCGVVVARPEGQLLVIDGWVLTCPVLGKGVEGQILRLLIELAVERQCSTVTFRYCQTPSNGTIREYLATLISGSATASLDSAAIQVAVGQRAEPAVGTPGPSGSPVPPRHRRRPPGRPSTAGRLTKAAQILQAVEAGRPGPTVAAGSAAPPRTDKERRLLKVFRDVLHAPNIGVDTSFFVYGDSMLAVQFVAKANLSGLRVTLRQVFQHKTVAGLASVASEVARDDEDVMVTSAPLLPLQSWFFGLNLADPGHFNQSQRFELPRDVDVDAVRHAVAALLDRHSSLRMRFVRTAGGVHQEDPGPPPEAPFAHIDLGALNRDDWEPALVSHELHLHKAMSPERGRLAAFAVFTFGRQRPPQLLVMFHHLAIDGITWRILLGDLQEGYRQALRAGRVVLAPQSFPVLAWARRLHAFAQSSQVRAELPRWLGAGRTQVEALPRDVPDASGRGVLTHSAASGLTASETAALRELALSVHQVSLEVLLLAAAVRVLAGWARTRRLLVDVVNHGREAFAGGVDLSRTAGWLVLNVPVIFDVDDPGELAGLVPAVNDQLRHWSSDHGAGDNLLRFLSADESVRKQLAALPGADVLFSYGGDIDSGRTGGPLLGRSVPGRGPDIDPGADTPYLLQFEALIIGGRFHAEIGYRAAQYRAPTIRRLVDEWVGQLRGLIRDTPALAGPYRAETEG
jgi:FkbH-like protein/non-ribosomal peptide synthase protein (TIGR01720 family)